MATKITADNLAPTLTAAITQGGGPKITNIVIADPSFNTLDDTAVSLSGGHIKILGTGFADGCQVTIGTTPASSITFVSSTELRVNVSSRSVGSYPVYVTNLDGGSAIRINGLTYSDFPAWSTGSSLGIKFRSHPFDILVAANADSNVTYSLAPGSSLPLGANLLSNGLITGNVFVDNETTFNFVLIATDQENQNTNSSFSLTISAGSQYPTIEGGTVTTSGDFKIHTFTSSSNLNIIYPGILDSNIWYLIVGGGAGAGGAAGGGAGGFLEGNVSIPSSTIKTNVSILVGAGGSVLTNGGNSLISLFPAITSFGGGTGGKFAVPGNGTTYKGDTGGSGGGSGGNSNTGSVTVPGGAGIPGQGNPGGAGYGNPGSPSGGGGGAGGAGGPYGPMVGGVGKQSSISGSAVYYAGGGGGGSFNVGGGTGGLGGGGNGTAGGTPAGSGTANTGGGGGGNGGGAASGSGGSGVVIIRYRYQ